MDRSTFKTQWIAIQPEAWMQHDQVRVKVGVILASKAVTHPDLNVNAATKILIQHKDLSLRLGKIW